jgi:hypothetical protein
VSANDLTELFLISVLLLQKHGIGDRWTGTDTTGRRHAVGTRPVTSGKGQTHETGNRWTEQILKAGYIFMGAECTATHSTSDIPMRFETDRLEQIPQLGGQTHRTGIR